MIHFQSTLVSFELFVYFQYIKAIHTLLNGTRGLPHIPHNMIYATNGTALKNKQKSNNAIHLTIGVYHSFCKPFNINNKHVCLYFNLRHFFNV